MITSIDLTGRVFTYLTVIEKWYNGKQKYLWHCKCKCGNDVYASAYDLLSGKTKSCGCYKIELTHNRTVVHPGDVYGKLTVLERVENLVDDHSKWDCICECGNHVVVLGKDLTSGKRSMCTECALKRQHDMRAVDITGQRFGKLVAIECVGSKKNARLWRCKCDCGQETYVPASMLKSGNTRSCGCMRAHSYNENLLSDMIAERQVSFKREFSFSDLVSDTNTCLRFDFAIFDQDTLLGLIEYQGEQHYIIANNGFGKYQREVSDQKK